MLDVDSWLFLAKAIKEKTRVPIRFKASSNYDRTFNNDDLADFFSPILHSNVKAFVFNQLTCPK